jgi:hypothetical protein
MAKLFSSRHKGTKTLRNNNKILRVFVPWWQMFLVLACAGLKYKI